MISIDEHSCAQTHFKSFYNSISWVWVSHLEPSFASWDRQSGGSSASNHRTCLIGKHMSYARRLEMFDLQSLEDRRSIIDFVTYHKILCNWTRINLASLFSMNTRLFQRTNNLSLTMPLCHTSAFLHSFHVRAISRWNCLPDSVMTPQRSSCFSKGAAMHLA